MPPSPHSAGHLQVLILVKVTVLLGGDTERRRNSKKVANSVDNLRMSSPSGTSIEQSVSSSYGIDMIALTMMFRNGSKIEINLTTEWEIGPGQAGRQAGSVGA